MRLSRLFILFLPAVLAQYQQQRYPQYGNGQPQQFGQQQYGQQQQQQPQQYQQGRANPQFNQQNNYQQQQQQRSSYNQQPMQGQYGQQGQMGQMDQGQMNQQKSGRQAVVNTPVKTGPVTQNNVNSVDGAQVTLKLNSYSNSGNLLSNTTTCACPVANCAYLSQNQQNACSFGFTTIISSKDQSAQIFTSDFFPFDNTINSGNWTTQYTFTMPTKPVAVDVLVQHLGVVIRRTTAQLEFFNHLSTVDTFVVDMSQISVDQSQGARTLSLTGQLLNTQLQMQLGVQCINNKMGADCDLTCPSATTNSNNVVCYDSENRTASCVWNTYRTQVVNCMICSQLTENGTCYTYNVTQSQTGVSSAFRVWTIVLGCLLGIAVLIILCLIVTYIIIRNRAEQDEGASYQDTYGNKSTTRPLIGEDEWATAAPRRTTETTYRQNGHTAAPSPSRQEHQV